MANAKLNAFLIRRFRRSTSLAFSKLTLLFAKRIRMRCYYKIDPMLITILQLKTLINCDIPSDTRGKYALEILETNAIKLGQAFR